MVRGPALNANAKSARSTLNGPWNVLGHSVVSLFFFFFLWGSYLQNRKRGSLSITPVSFVRKMMIVMMMMMMVMVVMTMTHS